MSVDVLGRVLEEAFILNHRRMLVICGDDSFKLASSVKDFLVEACRRILRFRDGVSVLYAYHSFYDDALERLAVVEGFRGDFGDEVVFQAISYKRTDTVLGLSFDVVVLDLLNDFNPNDVGRLTGLVRGGGLIILLTPSLDSWPRIVSRFKIELATIQYPISTVRTIFIRRVIGKLFDYDGIAIYSSDEERYVKPFTLLAGRYTSSTPKRSIKIPKKSPFPKRAFRLALTQDQVEVLKLFENLIDRPKGRLAIVITADRGRGKSCSVGIGLAVLGRAISFKKMPVKILVTAPNLLNVQSLMELALRTFKFLGYEKINVIRRDNFIVRIETRPVIIEYREPLDAITRRADLIAVDEAAGIPVPMLYEIWRRFRRLIFSSTIHGYEGAGRGFSVRFLKALKEDSETRVIEYEMTEPIRYAENDPIERWLFDTLMLDAEPAEIDDEDLKFIEKLDLNYVKPDLESLFLKEDGLLKQFIGIYVLAHYRNQPKDLAMMADAPHHTIRMLTTPTGKVVCSIQLAEEGPIPEKIGNELLIGARVQGNIIPDRFIKHFRSIDFGRFVGWRIVRIATHINLMGRGIGSFMLERVCEEAREKGYDWVGAGFGVSERLLKFWIKNGFIPIHISPDRNPISGEFTVIVIKPLNSEVSRFILEANREFRRRLVNSLYDTYRDLEPEIAHLLLMSWNHPVVEGYSPQLSRVQIERLRIYAWGPMTLEGVVDGVFELAKCYFYDVEDRRPRLTAIQELMLISKVLQARSWRNVCDLLNLSPPLVMTEMRIITRILLEHYCNVSPLTEYEEFD